MNIFRGAIGLCFIISIAYAFSSDRENIDWQLVASGIFIQLVIGLLIAKVAVVGSFFGFISDKFVHFLNFALGGAEFLFGDLAKNSDQASGTRHSLGFLFAFQALPIIIFFSSVTAGLYYLGILQKIVWAFAWLMSKTMRLSGAESVSVAGNIFLGQTEAPLLVRPFIAKMTSSELNCLMTGGMATLAGSVLSAYVVFLGGSDPESQTLFATYLVSASVMNAPAAIVMSKMFLPEATPEKIDQHIKVNKEQLGVNLIDALSKGATDGVKLVLNIGGMLLAFIAIILAINWILMDGIGAVTGLNAYVVVSTEGAFEGFSLQYILGQIFRLFAFAIGISWSESLLVGSLLGQKFVINEFVGYLSLAEMKVSGVLSEHAIMISTYALCGFANLSSIGIQIGGIGVMAPERRGDLSLLGFRALIGASLATLMTAAIAGAIF